MTKQAEKHLYQWEGMPTLEEQLIRLSIPADAPERVSNNSPHCLTSNS